MKDDDLYIIKSYPITNTSPNKNQLQTAKLMIIETYVSDGTSRRNDLLCPNTTTKILHCVWNGTEIHFTVATCDWDKTAGTITMNTNYSDRNDIVTVKISRYYMWF